MNIYAVPKRLEHVSLTSELGGDAKLDLTQIGFNELPPLRRYDKLSYSSITISPPLITYRGCPNIF